MRTRVWVAFAARVGYRVSWMTYVWLAELRFAGQRRFSSSATHST